MAYVIFVSHSTKDKIAADAAVAHLERNGLRCWCAPRDILPGMSWANAIVQAIASCRAMVVLISENANQSGHIGREVELAVSHGIPVVPVRIENVMPHGDLEYFLSSAHWMDAITPPLERHFDQLAAQLQALLGAGAPPPPLGITASKETRTVSRSLIPAIAIVAVLVIAGVTIWKTQSNKPLASTQPVTQPSPPPLPTPSPRPSPAPSPSPSPPVPAPAPRPNPATQPDIERDNQAWQQLALIHVENSYFLDNGPTHYTSWRSAADAGDPTAQFFVGCCYAQGAGVKENYADALHWFQLSADAGNTDAMMLLANRYWFGLGTQQNFQLFFTWIKKASDAGNISATACYGSGLIFTQKPENQPLGQELLARAGAGGSCDAQFFSAYLAGLSPSDFLARIQIPAAAGQPDSIIFIASLNPSDPANMSKVRRAMHLSGNPLDMQNCIDPPTGFYHVADVFVPLAWQRLHEMADGGFEEAGTTLTSLKAKGFTDPVAPAN